jgi:hypothetical protein
VIRFGGTFGENCEGRQASAFLIFSLGALAAEACGGADARLTLFANFYSASNAPCCELMTIF